MSTHQSIEEARALEDDLIRSDIGAFLDQNEKKELCRFVTVGSVDDGKSTLIGRLLHDSKGVYDDQLADATRTSDTGETAIDFARITDGLRAEREQGITIDVAYRYFSTPRRKFIIADTPGHVQYTRNMATGASTANIAIILIDARLGVLPQSRRHATIGDLLGIPHLLVCINKMDLVDYGQARFDELAAEFGAFAGKLGFTSVTFIPISALMGINVVEKSAARTPWYSGPTVLEFLETVKISGDANLTNFRMPVQVVIRPNLDYRGFAGQVVSGVIEPGDAVVALPSGKTSTVISIDTYDGPLARAWPPMSVVLRLKDEIDISRGDVICKVDDPTRVDRRVEADVVWMSETPLDPGKSYLIKHGTAYVRVNVEKIEWKLDLQKLEQVGGVDELGLNDIGRVRFTTHRPLCYDPYRRNRATGAFILIDSLTNNTVGAAMIVENDDQPALGAAEGARSQVSARERRRRLGHPGAVIWLDGAPGEARSRLAFALERRLFDLGNTAAALDPADPRYAGALPADEAGRHAWRMADAGLLVVVSPDEAGAWASARQDIGPDRFLRVAVGEAGAEADVSVPLDAEPAKAVEAIVAVLGARGLLAER